MKRLSILLLAALACSHHEPQAPKPAPLTEANIGAYAYIWIVNSTDSTRLIQMGSKELHMMRTLGTVPAHDSVKYLIPMVETRVDLFVDGWYMETVMFKSVGLYRTEILRKHNGNPQ